ncbi:MAG: Lon protease family protein, partial [Euryarchaeota archaeon]|nr:Lon protease family protein [Euryarchaeota archaeon]
IAMDGRIPHATRAAVEAVIRESRKRAKRFDGIDGSLSLRLRELGGLIRAAGDIASIEESQLIEEKHVEGAVKRSMTAEEQIKERYGSYVKGLSTDISDAQKEKSQYYFANENADRGDMYQ